MNLTNIALAITLLSSSTSVALATTIIPAASASEGAGAVYCSCNVAQNNSFGAISYSNPTLNGFGAATASAASGPVDGLVLSATATGNTDAGASVSYFFEIAGPGNGNVLVDVSGLLQASMTGPILFNGPVSYAVMNVSVNGNTYLQEQAAQGYGYNQVPTDSFSDSVLLPANQVIYVQLSADAVADANHLQQTTTYAGTASVDPYFQIDPNFASSNPGYSLAFSSGINNVPASSTPEPASFVSLGTGLLVSGWLVRHRAKH
jgi:hypothetical protein